jgi:hypothetical protein
LVLVELEITVGRLGITVTTRFFLPLLLRQVAAAAVTTQTVQRAGLVALAAALQITVLVVLEQAVKAIMAAVQV